MIKKSLFEDELMLGMQRELQSYERKQGISNLVKAADYLQAAAEILEEAGLTKKADQVLQILTKIAHEGGSEKIKHLIEESLEPTESGGDQPLDIESIRPLDITERMSLKHPKKEVLEFTSLLPGARLPSVKDIDPESLMVDDNDAKPRKPKNPTKINDSHTKGLTPEKMVKNLEGHGTVFNMADDGKADDLLDADLDEKPLEVFEQGPGKTFEDSD